ncbi:hypothetical protein BKA66DRAFT_456529 [Pyrenochaeta sp. MPI-SDFR-AT-0127]|nr:hypothetical protein BKA66DRAFT_456529 [Pyrenochaeta sp. MPI-SDFR-AT-0127]
MKSIGYQSELTSACIQPKKEAYPTRVRCLPDSETRCDGTRPIWAARRRRSLDCTHRDQEDGEV